MNKDILIKILQNNNDFTQEEQTQIEKLIKDGIINQTHNGFVLSKKYKIGKIIIQNNTIKFESFDNRNQNIFIDETNIQNCNNNDIVLIKMIFNPRGRLKGKVVQLLSKSDAIILGYMKENKIFTFKTDRQIPIDQPINNLKQYDVVLIKDDKIIEILGNIADPQIDEKISLFLYGQDYRLEQYTSKISQPKQNTNRIDLTHLDFCTIDPATAKDHDDAIYYDHNEHILYVAIADVSSYIKDGGSLDQQAKKRAFSIYLPHKVFPMIPFELSANLCSLKPNVKRFAYVMKIYLDTKKLQVTNSELIEAVIISKHKYSYEQIDDAIKQNSLEPSLEQLYKLTVKLRKKRLQNGYDFRTSEYKLILDQNQNLIDTITEYSSSSHQLVEECMLLANIQAAKKLENIGIFRVHDEPSRKSIDKLLEDLNLLGLKIKLKEDIHKTIESIQQKAANANLTQEVDKLIIQAQQQARYSSEVAPHFGLGFSHYSHFTSPIRRYSDLVLHRILKTKQIPKDIDNITTYISTQEREIAKLVWDFEDRKYARWANKHINETYKAKIVDIDEQPKGELIQEMKGLRFDIQNYQSQQLFSEIMIKIISSDIITKKIICEIIVK